MEQGERRRHARIAVDFDGTLARKSWPVIDKDTVWNDVLDSWLKRHKARGDYVMLWTCRENYGGIRFPDH